MIRSGLLGRSILASRSPELHEKEAQAQGLDLSYELFDFTARGWADSDLPAVLKRLVAEGFSGFNVTYPFKQAVVPLLDELDDTALAVGAVNTVSIHDGRLIGYNTDMAGFRDSVIEGLPDAEMDNVVQLGAGGAGAAVANALLSLGVGALQLVDVDQ
ncbi:MAG: shikimate dehydrogenase, partial [Novosphingobium sp.]